jgi:hypothetical protein
MVATFSQYRSKPHITWLSPMRLPFTLIVHVFMPSNAKSGQQPIRPVTMGATPIQPHGPMVFAAARPTQWPLFPS